MKLKYKTTTVAVLTLLLGCNSGDQKSNETKSDTPVTAGEVKQQYKEAATATKQYVTGNKDEFISAMEKKLKEIDDKISELAKKSESFKDDARVQADKTLAALREERSTVNTKFEEMKKASAEAWENVKETFASAMAGLEKAYENAKSKFD
jgi:CHASE3 domain sensor protein